MRVVLNNHTTVCTPVWELIPSLNVGWSGGATGRGKLPVPGFLRYLDNNGARAYWACSGCWLVVVWTFILLSIFFLSPS